MLCSSDFIPLGGPDMFIYKPESRYASVIEQQKRQLDRIKELTPDNSDAIEVFSAMLKQKMLDEEKWIEEHKESLYKINLVDKFAELYGKEKLPAGRNYVKLAGRFLDSQGFVADIPPIEYIFQ